MTTFITILPIGISALLSAAHFYRAGYFILTAMSILLPFLLVSKNQWVPKIISISLLLAAGEWIRTLVVFIEQYQAAGVAWSRMAIILGTVAVCTASSALVFTTSTLKKRYAPKEP